MESDIHCELVVNKCRKRLYCIMTKFHVFAKKKESSMFLTYSVIFI